MDLTLSAVRVWNEAGKGKKTQRGTEVYVINLSNEEKKREIIVSSQLAH